MKMMSLIKLLLKLLIAPVLLALTLFVWLCMGLLYCSSYLLGLAGTLLGLLGLGELLLVSVPQGIALLAIAFLVGPLGLPMAATWLLGKLLGFKYFIQEKVYG